VSFPDANQPFVVGTLQMPGGTIPRISSTLTHRDRLGTIAARWGIGRMSFKLGPGLYALGSPDNNSPVLVTANYKMSFDSLRKRLGKHSAWILVLDTKGINVWCAAGKGTFGTDELISKIRSSDLTNIVSHRKLILPQLSAPGIAAHVVKKETGFKVIYGPVSSSDLPAFIRSGYVATPEMRLKQFPLKDRATLIPMELVIALKWMILILPAIFCVGGLLGKGPFWNTAWRHGLFADLMLLAGLMAGTIITPLLFPWLPGRPFSVKGFISAAIITPIVLALYLISSTFKPGLYELLAAFMFSSSLASFLAMNFTGSSTYTSLSGVRKEMKWSVPLQISGGILGLLIWMGALYTG
jgi:hypothetical protein